MSSNTVDDEEPNAVTVEGRGTKVWTVTVHRPDRRNAVNGPTARKLYKAFLEFDHDPVSCVAVLYGKGGVFCAGADLMEMSNPITTNIHEIGPMGISRLRLSKPVIAAVDGFCVAGGLELACWCDMRVAAEGSTFGVFCRRWFVQSIMTSSLETNLKIQRGVPLIDGGTVRLPRLIGQSRAMDMILTGRGVDAQEALGFGLVNRVVAKDDCLRAAQNLARDLAELPQNCMRNDRTSSLDQWSLPEKMALSNEFSLGISSLRSEAGKGASKFRSGAGRKGARL